MGDEKIIPEQNLPNDTADGGVVVLAVQLPEEPIPEPEDSGEMDTDTPESAISASEEEASASPENSAEGEKKKKPFWQTVWFWGGVIFMLFLLALGTKNNANRSPLSLDLLFSIHPNFTTTGEIYLTGFDRLTAEEIEAALTIKPDVGFSIEIDEKDPKRAIVALKSARNIAYEIAFEMEIEIPESADTYQASGRKDINPKTEVYSYKTVVNGPAMTVRLSNTRITDEYQPVVLEFSENVNVDSLEQNLKIEPRAHYIIDYSRRTVSLHPEERWTSDRNYTITIGTGYKSANGKQFAGRQTLPFRIIAPVNSTYPSVSFDSDRTYILNDSRDMTLMFSASHLKKGIPVVVETYRVPSIERYREQGHIFLNYDVPLDLLEKVDANVFLIKNGSNQFKLPHPGDGSYIVSITYTEPHTGLEVTERAGYLITPLSVYIQASSRDTLVWINSSNPGGSLEGYKIYFGDNDQPGGVTDKDGMIILNHEKDNENDFSIYNQNDELVYYDYGPTQGGYHEERYYSYLFTDRTLYRPEDTVCYWGFVQPFRNNKMEMPSTVTVTLDPGGLDIVQEVEIDSDGVFHGELALEKIKSSQYPIQASLHFPSEKEGATGAHHIFETRYVSVKEFQKPSYTLSSGVDKSYYSPGDSVTVTAGAAFYDGTPLPLFPVEISYYDSAKHSWVPMGNVETDDIGNVTFTFPAWQGGSSVGAGPTRGRYMVHIASDGEDITHIGNYTVFPSDILIDAKLERQPNGQNLALNVRTYKLNLESPALKSEMERLSNRGYYGYLDNNRLLEIARGEPTDVENIQMALRWDFIDSKGIRRRYVYDRDWGGRVILFSNNYSLDYIVKANPDRPVKVAQDRYSDEKIVEFSTKNGSATITDLIWLDEGTSINFSHSAYCRALVTLKDGLNNTRSAYAYYPGASSYREDWGESEEKEFVTLPGYSFAVKNLTLDTDITPENNYYRYINMNIGDTARFDLLLDSIPVDTNGKILYCIVQDGVYEYRLVSGNSFDLQYKMAYGTSFNLVAVYFDGHGTRAIRQITINANESSMDVNVEVTPDRDSYRPGDTVRLVVKATDSRGNGVAGNICVAVVDESIFALSEQYIDILWQLHYDTRWLDNNVRQYFTAYRDEIPDEYPMDGGKGGDGGTEFYDSYRSNFKDTATFLPATTNSAGNAYLTFDLPDNTTSWRITAVSVGDNLMAGYSKSNIISTLPFFCKPVMTSKYIEGDDFAMLVQGHGTLLDQDSEITYTVTVTGDNFSETKTISGKAYSPQELNFGKLPIGSYTVVSKAQYSGYSDTVELPVSVIKSNLELVIHKEIELGDTIDIEAVRYPVTITFYDNHIQPFITSINSLFGHYCMQTSQRMSRVVAKQAIRYSMPGENIPTYIADTSENISDMQNSDGGIGPYLDSTSEPLLTTYVLLAAKDQFNLRAMADYYNRQLKTLTNPKEIAACHLGLAVIGEMDAKALLDYFESAKTTDVKAYYIAALTQAGEAETALKLYDEHCAPYAKISQSVPSATWERDAAACWIAATLLGHEDADALSLHFGTSVWRFRTLYECMIYVTYYDKIIEPSTLTYTVKGQQQSVRFGLDDSGYNYYYGSARGSYMRTVVLSKSELESLRFINIPESVRAVAYYIGEPTELGLEQSDNMSISKSISPVDDVTYEVTLTIKLDKDAPTGQYDISDWVPSNTRLYGTDREYNLSRNNYIYFSTRSEGQNLYISFYNSDKGERVILYKYRVRKTFSSESALDTVYMIHGDSGENCNSQKNTFSTK